MEESRRKFDGNLQGKRDVVRGRSDAWARILAMLAS
jgi:hypothetical protein